MAKQITSLQHPTIKHLVKLRQNHDYREEHGSVVIAGVKEVKEICSHAPTKTLLVYDETFIPKGIKAKEVLVVSEEVMKKASGLQAPEGVLAEVEMPKTESLQGLKYIVALDGVSDPGNMGSLLRTALALGWEGVFIVNESCDPFNDKALRAARGATFRLPLGRGTWDDLHELIKKNKLQPLAGDLNGTSLTELKVKKGILLVLSNEAHGLSEHAAEHCEKVKIPISKQMESLNVAVAGGILMYALKGADRAK